MDKWTESLTECARAADLDTALRQRDTWARTYARMMLGQVEGNAAYALESFRVWEARVNFA